MKYLKAKKENWILLISLICFTTLTVFFLSVDSSEAFSKSSRNQLSNSSLEVFIFLAIIIAPIIEEFSFRGNFFQHKWKWASIVFLGVYYFSSSMDLYILLISLLCYFSIFVVNQFHDSKLTKILLYTMNPILFMLVHYEIEDFTSINTSVLMLSQLGGGFLLVWVFINYGFWKTTILHASINLVFILFMIAELFNVSNEIQRFNVKDDIVVEYSKIDYNLDPGELNVNEDLITCNNCQIIDLFQQAGIKLEELSGYTVQNQFFKYDIKISSNPSNSHNFINDLYDNHINYIELIEGTDLINKNK